jgi:hypothetical protein
MSSEQGLFPCSLKIEHEQTLDPALSRREHLPAERETRPMPALATSSRYAPQHQGPLVSRMTLTPEQIKKIAEAINPHPQMFFAVVRVDDVPPFDYKAAIRALKREAIADGFHI